MQFLLNEVLSKKLPLKELLLKKLPLKELLLKELLLNKLHLKEPVLMALLYFHQLSAEKISLVTCSCLIIADNQTNNIYYLTEEWEEVND